MIGSVVSIYEGVEVILPIISLFSNEFDEHVLDGPIEMFNKSIGLEYCTYMRNVMELHNYKIVMLNSCVST